MAKAAGTGRINIPHVGSGSGSSKAAGRIGTHEEVSENLAEKSKLESGGGSEPTPRSRASLPSQMEEEQEVTGEKPNDAAANPKKKKKNKKKGKAASTVEDIRSTAVSAVQEPEVGLRSKKALEAGTDATPSHPHFPVSSLKVERSISVVYVDEGGNAGWVQKLSNSGRGLPPGSSWEPVGAKDACGWDDPPPVDVVEDSGWHVYGGEANVSAVHSSNGNWDEPVARVSSEWDSGWEVAGSRRGKKKGEDSSTQSSGVPNIGQQKTKGGGKGIQPNSGDYVQRGVKQRPNEREKVTTGRGVRSPGYGFQEKGVGRSSPRNPSGPSNFGTARQLPIQSNWGKPMNKSMANSPSWDTTGSMQGANTANGGSSSYSASSFGNLPAFDLNPGEQSLTGLSIDAWKGGFPPFSGNGSSVFEDSPASPYSDSQFSDEDLDSDTMSLGSFESEDSHKSHSTQRKNKWFRNFFQELDFLTEEQLHEHDRQWHCPACQGGVGAIDWYRGLQPLLAHAKTVRSKRVKLHKAFAEVLEEEIRIRGAALGTHGSGKYGKWRGLGNENERKQVVWPPMVVIRNTQLEQDEDEKWIGMGNKELLDLFKTHSPVKARHAYGPQGHRGISILIFAESPTGYYNAQRLETQFTEARRGKDNWNAAGKLLFQPGGDRILYGYLATTDDLEIFNKHSKGKQKLKWELNSFQDMVLSPMRKLDEENKKVTILQVKVQREQETSRALKKTVSQISKQLEMRDEELTVIRNRAREQHQQQQIELDDMECLYKEKIEQLKKEIFEKEIALERVHKEYEQEHIEQCEKLEQQVSKMPKDQNLSDEQQQQQNLVAEEIAKHSQLVEMCIKNQEQWEERKAELLKEHHQKMMEFKARQWEDLIKFEQKLEQERLEVMETFNFPTKVQALSPGNGKA